MLYKPLEKINKFGERGNNISLSHLMVASVQKMIHFSVMAKLIIFCSMTE
jgi:hypothetical protein